MVIFKLSIFIIKIITSLVKVQMLQHSVQLHLRAALQPPPPLLGGSFPAPCAPRSASPLPTALQNLLQYSLHKACSA